MHTTPRTIKDKCHCHKYLNSLPQITSHIRDQFLVNLYLFRKNGSFYSNNVFLPLLIPKFFDFYKPKQGKSSDKSKNIREVLQFRYNKKMLPKTSSLKGYF